MIELDDESKTFVGYRSQPQVFLGYRRKSMVRNQADLVSPERQTRACEAWVDLLGKNYKIEWYEDVEGHKSGRYEEGRPGWQELLRQLERSDVVGAVVDSLDRAHRNVREFLGFLDRVEKLDKQFLVVKQGLDTKSAIGRAIVTILMAMYQLESDQTSERMTTMIDYKRRGRGQHWGPTPFGCDRDENGQLIKTEKSYWLNPITGEACAASAGPKEGWEHRFFYDGLIEIYHTYANGCNSYAATADIVNKMGWRYYANRKGVPHLFKGDDIRRIVSFWQLFRGDLPLGNITNTSSLSERRNW